MDDPMQRAKVQMFVYYPFWASLVMRRAYIKQPGVGTACTDGRTVWYDPNFIAQMAAQSDKHVQMVLAHEVCHIMYLHHLRRGTRDPKRWNFACDYVINLVLEKDFPMIKDGFLYDTQYEGMSAEKVYDLLPEDLSKCMGGGLGDIKDFDGTPIEAAAEKQAVIDEVVQAEQAGRMAGKLPGGLEIFLRDLLTPKVDWVSALRRFVEKCADDNSSWSHPDRRFAWSSVILPSCDSERLPNGALLFDTSGSVTCRTNALERFASELTSIMSQFNTKIDLIYVDTEAHPHVTLTSSDLPLEITPLGGGGTDFVPGFEYIAEHDLKPKFAIYFTDLECSSFPEEPDYPVLWLYLGEHGTQPPFGEVVHISEEE